MPTFFAWNDGGAKAVDTWVDAIRQRAAKRHCRWSFIIMMAEIVSLYD
jgi:hypothetical protein